MADNGPISLGCLTRGLFSRLLLPLPLLLLPLLLLPKDVGLLEREDGRDDFLVTVAAIAVADNSNDLVGVEEGVAETVTVAGEESEGNDDDDDDVAVMMDALCFWGSGDDTFMGVLVAAVVGL